jgi:glutamate-1-semialdehyde 2,1-aminomutase
MKTSIIIQARLGSKRLPNKIFKKIDNKTILEIIFRRLSKSKRADDIIFAIPKNRENLELKNFITKKLKAKIFLGPEEDVLKRYYMTARKFKSDIIVRITSDCPFADPSIIDNYIDILKRDNLDYVYNGYPHTYPDGFDVEVFNFKSLKAAHKSSKLTVQKDGVTRYFRDNLKKFKTKHIKSPIKNISKLRVTLDEEDDFNLINSIFNYFKPNIYISWLKIVELAKLKKSLFKINSAINNNEGRYLDNNQKLWKRANSIIPGGNSLLSKNPDLLLPGGWPTYYSKAKKIHIWDLTKKKYTDVCTMGVGTNILGYANTQVDNKVKHFIDCGNISTLNSPEEVQLAEKLLDLHPGLDMAKFARTGGEANAIAIRIARAAQNKDKHKIAICGYHGWHDWYLSSNLDNQKNLDNHLISSLKPNGVPSFLKNTCYPFEYGDYKKFDQLISKKNIGIIMMEVTRNKLLNLKFLNHVRNVSKKKGVILIFDECTSGFRETLGGIYKKTNVQPDMIVLGKALGNGYPITAILGKKEIMSHAKQSFISSTFWTERLGPVAALKTLEIMEKIKSWEIITKNGKYLNKQWLKIANENHLNLKINGLPSISKFEIKSNNFQAYKTFITQEMLKTGFLASNSVYLSIFHEKKVLDRYLDKLNDLFRIIKKCENKEKDIKDLLSYPISKKPFKRLN